MGVQRESTSSEKHSTPGQAVLKRTQNFPGRAEVLNWGHLPPVRIWQGPETFMGVLGLESRGVGLCSGVWELIRLPSSSGQRPGILQRFTMHTIATIVTSGT